MNISIFQQCSNCGACYNVCPNGAISVQAEGLFYTPTVDGNRCVDCSRCVGVCPVNNDFEGNSPRYALAGWSTDNSIIMSSSSGGVFYGLATKVISEGGVVFSAIYSNDYREVKIVSTDDVPLDRMLKSKYVESVVDDCFVKIKHNLEFNRKVLFCGTPCQVAGLSRFLGREYDNLITCDFACGGVPSHQIYKRYLTDLERKHNARIDSVDFRPKTHGWKRHAIQIRFKNGKLYNRLGIEDSYFRSFLYGKYTVRDYCLECKFSNCHKADITIADFWLHNQFSTLDNKNGISLVLCGSDKGIRLINSISEKYLFEEIDLKNASYNCRKTETCKSVIDNRERFLKLYADTNLDCACQQFIPCSIKNKIKYFISRKIYQRKGR